MDKRKIPLRKSYIRNEEETMNRSSSQKDRANRRKRKARDNRDLQDYEGGAKISTPLDKERNFDNMQRRETR